MQARRATGMPLSRTNPPAASAMKVEHEYNPHVAPWLYFGRRSMCIGPAVFGRCAASQRQLSGNFEGAASSSRS